MGHIEVELDFGMPVSFDVVEELAPEVALSPTRETAAVVFRNGAVPSTVLRSLADWLDKHQVAVEEVNLDVS